MHAEGLQIGNKIAECDVQRKPRDEGRQRIRSGKKRQSVGAEGVTDPMQVIL